MQTEPNNVRRREAWDKVTGRAKYCDDLSAPDQLTVRILTSPHAYARIVLIDTKQALKMPGVKAIVTGREYPDLEGILIADRPPLAVDTVRYAGEPVVLIVAVDEACAAAALSVIKVEYAPMQPLSNALQAMQKGAAILHENLATYQRKVEDVYPKADSNIASEYHIRKGDAKKTLKECDMVVEQHFSLPPSGHLAMETRTAHCSISPDCETNITTASQSPFAAQEMVAKYFSLPTGQVRVHVPFVGGSYGGKASVMLEHLAYMASKAVGGRPVRIVLTREQDMQSAPSRMGLEADVKLGANKDGFIQAAEITYVLDCGAYSDSAPYMSKSMAVDCTGPYRIDNLWTDSFCVYTNRTYATSYRGFSHESYTFCIERALDMLANRLGINPWEIRYKNAIRPGNLTPTQVEATLSNVGDVTVCMDRLRPLCNWDEGERIQVNERTVRAKGLALLWKSANPPTNAPSGAFITFANDGSINMNIGVVEMGNGAQTRLASMLATKFRIGIDLVHVNFNIDTRMQPKHWKTVASLSGFLAGNALMRAADDAIDQIKQMASVALNCPAEDIDIENLQAFQISDKNNAIHFSKLVEGYKAPDGGSVGAPVLGRGGYMLKGLIPLDPQTGKGKAGPAWTVGAQAVEVELDTVDYTYRILNASTVMDTGCILDPKGSVSMIAGGMAMGLSMASREKFAYEPSGRLSTPNLRTYKLMHIGQEPDYRVDLCATPQADAPFGTRSFAEHGIIGMPAALGNALSTALGQDLNSLPLMPELIWNTAGGKI